MPQNYFLVLKKKEDREVESLFYEEKKDEEVTWIKGVSSIKTKLLTKNISTMNRGSIRWRLL